MVYKHLFFLLSLIQLGHCSGDWGGTRGPLYDIRQIPVGQHSVYFKREIRGRNYEGLSISTDGNMCNGPSKKTDFFVDSETIGMVFYKVKGDELQIYSQNVFTSSSNRQQLPD
ncbi:MAG: hypothetical protein IPL32_02655 [Chloracidobacterium sp.]|nr:hypothetical protein [Chloracidobacterium sp.]